MRVQLLADSRPRLLALLLCLSLAVPAAHAAVGTFGAVTQGTTAGVVGRLGAFTNVPAIGFLDNVIVDGTPESSEALILSFGGDAVVHQNDILLSNPSGSGVTGSVGGVIQTAPSGAFVATAAALRFADTLPAYSAGGPNGKFGPGEGLYIDLDASGGPSAADRVLVTGTGVSGSLGGVPGTQSETVWDKATECIYTDIGTSGAVDILDTLLSVDTGACANGSTLTAISGVKAAAGPEYYISSAATVSSGDYRITTTAGGAAGTMVNCGVFANPADADCGVALVAPPANTKVTVGSQAYAPAMTDFRFFDMNGNGVYDANDRVVLDVDQNAFVTPADVRMSSTGGQTYGSRPTIGSSEAHAILGLALAGTLMWLDGATNPGQVDSGEPIALHIGGGALRLALGDVCLMTVGGCTAGAQRIGTTTAPTTGGTWTDVTTATNPGTLGYLDANNNNVYDVGDTLYLHFGAVPGNIANGDLVLAADGGASGSTVTAAGGALKVAFAPSYRALDVDGSGDYSVGDIVYDDHHGLATAAEPGDIRVSSGAGVTGFGKNLKDTDPDAVLALFNPTPSGPLFGFRDVDASTTLTPDEPVFLMPRATGCPLIGSDVNLSPGTGATTLTAGSFVAGALQTTCITVPGTPMFAYAPTGVFTSTSQLALDVNGNGALGVGDIWITGGTGGASGSRVTGAPTTATDLTLGVTTLASRPGPVDIRVVDASGDGVAASLETVVLDIDGDGFFTPGDVPLSGTGTSASSGGGGGGGGTVSTATTTATSTATATDTATDTATSTTTTASLPSLDDMNKAIAASLTVTHDADGNNVVKWAGQPGALGYQVWSHASPWAFVMSVDASMTTVVQKAPASTHYLVTAFTSEATKLTDINTQPVPGLGASPTGPAADGNAMEAGSTSASKTKGAIPGVEVVAGLAAVAVALALARRRLA